MKSRIMDISQSKGAAIFTKHGLCPKYGIALEKRFAIAHRRSKALFPDAGNPLHNPLGLFISNKDSDENIIITVNYLYLAKGYNPLYFSRRNILRIRENRSGTTQPLNTDATGTGGLDLDSS